MQGGAPKFYGVFFVVVLNYLKFAKHMRHIDVHKIANIFIVFIFFIFWYAHVLRKVIFLPRNHILCLSLQSGLVAKNFSKANDGPLMMKRFNPGEFMHHHKTLGGLNYGPIRFDIIILLPTAGKSTRASGCTRR